MTTGRDTDLPVPDETATRPAASRPNAVTGGGAPSPAAAPRLDRPLHVHRAVRSEADRETELVYRFRWSMTQVAVLAMGVFLMALGGIAFARAGAAGFDSLINPEVVVAVWHRTPLMGLIELGLGLLLIVAGSQKLSPTGLYRVLGAVALVFGIVLAAQPTTFDAVLGASRNTGWVYSFLGAVLLGLGFGAPIVFERERISSPSEGEVARGSNDG